MISAIDSIPDCQEDRISAAILRIINEENERTKKILSVENGDFYKENSGLPIVPASTYSSVQYYQRVYGYSSFDLGGDVDLPVAMRGSRHCINASHGRLYWERKVIERYMRKIKFTSFDRKQIHIKILLVIRKRRGVRGATAISLENGLGGHAFPGSRVCYISGVRYVICDKTAWAVAKKLGVVNSKLAAVELERRQDS